ncbi:MAG TPA: alpha/beta hydrolase [Candidatus Limnocylindrales bacterium]|nr:alpha/beta hydrolase [Candidatus Limnocylindrales bacterium]
MRMIQIRDVSLAVTVVGRGRPIVLMHGGPGPDQWSLLPYRRLADRYTLVFYDHRACGRSTGATETMTWDNLTADADALRARLGFERWTVLGHSFGGHVALEYALRYPASVSNLILVNTAGDAWWSREHAAEIVERRGYGSDLAERTRRFFTGQIDPQDMMPTLMRLRNAYHHRRGLSLAWLMMRDVLAGEWRTRVRAEPLVQAGRVLTPGWTVMDRLGEISAPTLVLGGRDDFLFPPECQAQLAAGIPGARLRIIERAGHNPHSEEPERTMAEIKDFLRETPVPVRTAPKTAASEPMPVTEARPHRRAGTAGVLTGA